MIDAAMRAWIEVALDDGQAIPEPRPLESYSGKFIVRLPKSLHRQLADRADRDGVSLYALVNVALAQYVENGVHPMPRRHSNGSVFVKRKP
jgi:antitoxin HicB